MSLSAVWEPLITGMLQGFGLLAVVWAFHQVRKGIYYHRKWRFCLNLVAGGMPAGSSFENALKNAEGEPCYWTPMEDAGTGTVPGWYYAPTPMSTKRPAWWPWMKRSFVLAYKHQQWKPAEYLTIAQWAERFGGPASAVSALDGGIRRTAAQR